MRIARNEMSRGNSVRFRKKVQASSDVPIGKTSTRDRIEQAAPNKMRTRRKSMCATTSGAVNAGGTNKRLKNEPSTPNHSLVGSNGTQPMQNAVTLNKDAEFGMYACTFIIYMFVLRAHKILFKMVKHCDIINIFLIKCIFSLIFLVAERNQMQTRRSVRLSIAKASSGSNILLGTTDTFDKQSAPIKQRRKSMFAKFSDFDNANVTDKQAMRQVHVNQASTSNEGKDSTSINQVSSVTKDLIILSSNRNNSGEQYTFLQHYL